AAGGVARVHRGGDLEAAVVARRAVGAVHAARVRARAAAARGRHRVARGAAGTQCTREGGPAVVLQRAQPGVQVRAGADAVREVDVVAAVAEGSGPGGAVAR